MILPNNIKALLFDMDGVIFDTEGLYTDFWKRELFKYLPDDPEIFDKVKGSTLNDILTRYFKDDDIRTKVVAAIDNFETTMPFYYINGFEEYFRKIKDIGYKCAVVTSSNDKKMANVFNRHPMFKSQYDTIITADDISLSKPNPQCFLLAAERLGVKPEDCAVFEDSIHGLNAARAAGMFVVGVATSNPYNIVKEMSDVIINDFKEI
ncbi:MAG: HAD-IA family hydrolase [Bacteroidales bacterium]|nr:HAD-IA family hydrolase [Bacteroidales bacterium]MBQ7819061.1 HAD-IA family hydrolase [Bacteroidales bacterium]